MEVFGKKRGGAIGCLWTENHHLLHTQWAATREGLVLSTVFEGHLSGDVCVTVRNGAKSPTFKFQDREASHTYLAAAFTRAHGAGPVSRESLQGLENKGTCWEKGFWKLMGIGCLISEMRKIENISFSNHHWLPRWVRNRVAASGRLAP